MEAYLLERHQQGVGPGYRRLCVHRCRQRQGADCNLLDYQEGSGEAYPHHRKNLREREKNRQLAPKGWARQPPIRVNIKWRSGDRAARRVSADRYQNYTVFAGPYSLAGTAKEASPSRALWRTQDLGKAQRSFA